MVKELLVNETLSDAMIHSGAQLIKQLEDSAAESSFRFLVLSRRRTHLALDCCIK